MNQLAQVQIMGRFPQPIPLLENQNLCLRDS
jgi:hypothetical protein